MLRRRGRRQKTFLTPANEVCEGYVFTGVCLSARGGHAWLLPGEGGCMVAPRGGMRGCSGGGHVWLLLGRLAWLLRGGNAWDTTRYGDTINEGAVRILLECILVRNSIKISLKHAN